MATSKNNKVISTVQRNSFPAGNLSRKGNDADFALVDKLQRWGRAEAASDMEQLKHKESTSKNEMEIAMCGLYASPIYQGIVGDFVDSPGNEISVLRLCGRMYLAGKLSGTRSTSTPSPEL